MRQDRIIQAGIFDLFSEHEIGVGNTRYVRFMYQMICPVLERFQAMEGGDASNGAGTGTETPG